MPKAEQVPCPRGTRASWKSSSSSATRPPIFRRRWPIPVILQGELTAGYELGRAGTIHVFIQSDVGLPFFNLQSTTYRYLSVPPYVGNLSVAHRYAVLAGNLLAESFNRRPEFIPH